MSQANPLGISLCRLQPWLDACLDSAGSPGDTNEKPIKLAVATPKAGKAVGAEIGRTIASLVADRLFLWDNLDVISYGDLDKMLGFEKSKQLAGCNDDSCITEIAGALNVDFMVAGNIDILGDVYVGSLQLMNLRNASVKSRAQFRVQKGKESELIGQINNAVDRLVAPFFQKKGVSLFGWVDPLWKGITERPYRSLMWTSFAASVGGLVVGGMNRSYANSDEDQHTGLVRQLQSEGKIIGTSGNLHFSDDATKSAYSNQIDGIKQSAETHTAIATAGFIGAAIFAGLGVLLWRFDSNGQNQTPATKMSFQFSESGTQVSLGGTF